MQAQLEKAGQSRTLIPDRPELLAGLDFYFNAYFDLGTTRLNGMGVSPISWLVVEQYAAARQLSSFSCYFLHNVVRRLDPIYVKWSNSNDAKRHKNRNNS